MTNNPIREPNKELIKECIAAMLRQPYEYEEVLEQLLMDALRYWSDEDLESVFLIES